MEAQSLGCYIQGFQELIQRILDLHVLDTVDVAFQAALKAETLIANSSTMRFLLLFQWLQSMLLCFLKERSVTSMETLPILLTSVQQVPRIKHLIVVNDDVWTPFRCYNSVYRSPNMHFRACGPKCEACNPKSWTRKKVSIWRLGYGPMRPKLCYISKAHAENVNSRSRYGSLVSFLP